MKTLPIRRDGKRYNSVPFWTGLVENADQSKPLTPDEMRKRIRVLDVIEQAEEAKADSIELEDAYHLILKEAVNQPKWMIANREIMQLIDDINEAKQAARPPRELKTA